MRNNIPIGQDTYGIIESILCSLGLNLHPYYDN